MRRTRAVISSATIFKRSKAPSGRGREQRGHAANELRAQVADAARRFRGGERGVEARPVGIEVQPGMRDLAPVGDLDAAKAVLRSELDAALQMAVGRDHPAAHVFRIAQTTERLRLEFGRADLAGEAQALLVLGEAALNVAAREMEVAAQEVDVRALLDEVVPLSRGLGPVEVGECAVQVFGDPLHGCETKPDRRPLAVVRGGPERALVGGPRLRHRAEVVQDLALKAGEGEAVAASVATARPRSTRALARS